MKTGNLWKRSRGAIRFLLLLLCAAMLVPFFAACGNKDDPKDPGKESTATSQNQQQTTVEQGPEFLFDKTDYYDDFNFLRAASQYRNLYFTDTGSDDSDIILSALYERDALVMEYLGVSIHSKTKDGLTDTGLVDEVRTNNMSDMKEYDAVLTHNYLGITAFISEDLLFDLYQMDDDIDFEADYWNLDAIEALEVRGKAYLALNDFMINSPCAVFFNKGMMKRYQIAEDPYELVRNGEWTLDKFFELTTRVSEENGDGVWDKNDIYGFGLYADWYPIQLVDSCEVEWLTPGPGQRFLNMSSKNQRYMTVYEKIQQMANAPSTYMWNWGDTENKINITDDRFLFTFAPVKDAYNYRGSDVKFGFLPYPKFDTDQKEYHSTEWSGMLCVPKRLKNEKMTAQTLECLAAFSTDTIRPAYYEKLLGTRLADEPDDADMISNYIFGNIVLDPAWTFQTKANEPIGILAYTIGKMLRNTLNKDPIDSIATNWEKYGSAAQKEIDKYINGIE